jgi:hypothetical protein
LTLTHQHFVNLYQLNIKKKKVHSIRWKYIAIERINKKELDCPLFVINTGGNHNPLIRQNKKQKKILEQKFPFKIKYEIINNNKNINLNNNKIKTYCNIFKLFIIINFLKTIFNINYI